jgi:mevalonate pyrophosphate decarboxylase
MSMCVFIVVSNLCFRANFDAFAEVVEYDSNLMHAGQLMTSSPPSSYWQPGSVHVMQQVRQWRTEGLESMLYFGCWNLMFIAFA